LDEKYKTSPCAESGKGGGGGVAIWEVKREGSCQEKWAVSSNGPKQTSSKRMGKKGTVELAVTDRGWPLQVDPAGLDHKKKAKGRVGSTRPADHHPRFKRGWRVSGEDVQGTDGGAGCFSGGRKSERPSRHDIASPKKGTR